MKPKFRYQPEISGIGLVGIVSTWVFVTQFATPAFWVFVFAFFYDIAWHALMQYLRWKFKE